MDPGYVVCDLVELCVVLGAGEGGGVALDGDDAVPAAGGGEGDGVAAGATEDVDEEALGGVRVGHVLCDGVGDGFRGHAEPGIVGEVDAVVIPGEDGAALREVSRLLR
ncbi:hypothetical protein CGCF415_v005527 [Colletotrichum fructicola]|nr:hypothetical protein CGCFRS4_v009633 [Colletotrichum fructicola]KAF4909885.1 hypothetical protein CGCF415_v005527 [Colletotrichum fructicola]KAF4930514.1 hypothetical protein CGCF245_v011659 [Colletotrichum fructicola]